MEKKLEGYYRLGYGRQTGVKKRREYFSNSGWSSIHNLYISKNRNTTLSNYSITKKSLVLLISQKCSTDRKTYLVTKGFVSTVIYINIVIRATVNKNLD